MHAAQIHGVIEIKNSIIPNKIFIWASIMFCGESMILMEKIITGMLKIIIIKLPIAKFLLFNKFIEPEIEDMQVIVGVPSKKLKKIIFTLTNSIFNKIIDNNIANKKGICKQSQKIITFNITITS